MSDIELDYSSDQEVSKDHSKLLKSVKKLDKGQRVTKAARSEPTLAVSEFHLVKSGVTDKDVVNVDDLVNTLTGKSNHRAINQKVKKAKRLATVLPKPLEKPAADKLKRQVVFENTQKDLHKWDPVVEKNRSADTLHFPLNEPSMRMQKTEDFVKRFRVQSELEKELAALEPKKPEPVVKKDDFPLTLAEMKEKRRETAKFRVQQSYQAAKAMRQNKIKSKKYHRVQRKALIKQQLKEFEQLQKTDPEAALEKMNQLDKVRAEERMTLRHKNSGQWAKNKMIRAKYDKDSRKDLAQQLAIGRELTQQIQKNDSDDEEFEDNNGDQVEEADKENPFFKKTPSEVDAFISEFRKFSDARDKKGGEEEEEEKEEKLEENFPVPEIEIPDSLNPVESVIEEAPNHQQISKKSTKKVSKKLKKDLKKTKVGTTEWSVEELDVKKPLKNSKALNIETMFDDMEAKRQKDINKKINEVKRKLTNAVKNKFVDEKEEETHENYHDLSMKRKKIRPQFDKALNETVGDAEMEPETREINSSILMMNGKPSKNKLDKRTAEIDPTKFIAVKPKHLKTMLPDDVTGGEGFDDSDDDDGDEKVKKDQFNIISEAFADDDVVDDFAKEKQEEIKKSQPEDINMVLPGWGSWTGQNIKVSKRKKARFIMKLPKDGPRKDENKGDVIIIQGGNEKIRKHLVSDLPYPFESVADFEASIRAPIGRDFVPEKSHKQLIEPSIKTKMGRIIEPMTEESLVQKDMKIRGKIPESILLKKKIKKDEKKNMIKSQKSNNKSKIMKKKNNSIVKTNK